MSRDKRVEHLSRIISRIVWLESRIESGEDQRGFFRKDVDALTWALDALQHGDPDLAPLVGEAEKLVEAHRARMSAQQRG